MPDTWDEEERHFVQSLLEETDRGCVLVAQSHIDKLLEQALRWRFANDEDKQIKPMINGLFGGEGTAPFESFRMKLKLVRLLQMIDKDSFNALSKLNSLRVHFAHHAGPVTLTPLRVKWIHDLLSTVCKADIRAYKKMDLMGMIKIRTELPNETRLDFAYVAWELHCEANFAVIEAKINSRKQAIESARDRQRQ